MYILNRLVNMLFNPQAEWDKIRPERISNAQIFLRYVVWIAALPALGYLISFFRYPSLTLNIRAAIISYVFALVAVDVSAYLINRLSTSFASKQDVGRALKLVAFGATPVFAAGVLNFVPVVGKFIWAVGALYTAYLFYLGLPVLMSTPNDKQVPYTVTAFVIFIGIYLGLIIVGGLIFGVGLVDLMGQ
ncbi:MAG: Yip1 family protein [candidate division KSB1 bacterium]